ncbi:MAG: CPBP family intramembrane metalloprotease [Planctomycetia bacterium]|nr:CPBP family intramembrane metalloprotease [Planctomycetia bacterium]
MPSLTEHPLETSRPAHWAAVLFVLVFPTLTTWLYFVVLGGSDHVAPVYAAAKVVQFAFPAAWVFLVQRKRVSLQRPDAKSLLWGLAFGVVAVGVILAAWYGYFKGSPLLAEMPRLLAGKLKDFQLTRPPHYLLFAAFLSLPHSLLEEYYWRWFAFGQLRRVVPAPFGIVLSSLGFMSHHVLVIAAYVPGAPGLVALFSLSIALGGGVWAWIYQRCGTLYGPWLSHFLLDCAVMYLGYEMTFASGVLP